MSDAKVYVAKLYSARLMPYFADLYGNTPLYYKGAGAWTPNFMKAKFYRATNHARSAMTRHHKNFIEGTEWELLECNVVIAGPCLFRKRRRK